MYFLLFSYTYFVNCRLILYEFWIFIDKFLFKYIQKTTKFIQKINLCPIYCSISFNIDTACSTLLIPEIRK